MCGNRMPAGSTPMTVACWPKITSVFPMAFGIAPEKVLPTGVTQYHHSVRTPSRILIHKAPAQHGLHTQNPEEVWR